MGTITEPAAICTYLETITISPFTWNHLQMLKYGSVTNISLWWPCVITCISAVGSFWFLWRLMWVGHTHTKKMCSHIWLQTWTAIPLRSFPVGGSGELDHLLPSEWLKRGSWGVLVLSVMKVGFHRTPMQCPWGSRPSARPEGKGRSECAMVWRAVGLDKCSKKRWGPRRGGDSFNRRIQDSWWKSGGWF